MGCVGPGHWRNAYPAMRKVDEDVSVQVVEKPVGGWKGGRTDVVLVV